MTDLLLQDLEILVSKKLAQILCYEKREMLGEQGVPARTTAGNRLCLSSDAGSVIKAGKAGGKKCYNLKT